MVDLKLVLPRLALFFYVLTVTVGAFSGGVWAFPGLVGGVLLFVGSAVMDRQIPVLPKAWEVLVLAVLGLFGAELLISSQVAVSVRMWVRLCSIYIPLLLLLSPRVQQMAFSRSFVPVVAGAMAIGALGLGIELLGGGVLLHAFKKATTSLTEYNRGMAHLVILAFPFLAGLWVTGYKKAAAALVLVLLFPASLTESRTAKLALVAGVFCLALAFYRPVWVRRALMAGVPLLAFWPFYVQKFFLAAPQLVDKLVPSWRHRVEIWDFLSYRIMERPWLGWGLGTTHLLDYKQPHGDMYVYAIDHAPHAHNLMVQVWVETGVLGMAVCLCFLGAVLRRIGRLDVALQPFALGAFASAVTVSMFGFDFWTDALWSAFALTACVFGMLQQSLHSGENRVEVEVV